MTSFLMLFLSFAAPAARAEFQLPDGPDRSLLYAKCRTCHDLQYVVESKGLTPGAWDGLLDDMESFGVELNKEERARILVYLNAYMSTNPVPAPVLKAEIKSLSGSEIFSENCTSCHRDDAKGIEGTFPPLAGNQDLFLSRTFPVSVLLNGMSGTISVNAETFEGDMPSFAHLADGDIATLVNYLRNHFDNQQFTKKMEKLTAADVAKLRKTQRTPEQVFALRKKLQ